MTQRTHCDDVDRVENDVKGNPEQDFVSPKGECDQMAKLDTGHEDTPRYYEIEQPMNDTPCAITSKISKT